jgi:hypothetical protein
MNLFAYLPSIPVIRPMFNIGGLLDIPTGTYYFGINGEAILNGGLSSTLSIAGPGNSFKTAIACFINLTVAERIKEFQCSIYDTEGSFHYNRLNQLSLKLDRMSKIDFTDPLIDTADIRFQITSSADMLGDVYFDEILKISKMKVKSKLPLLTTPFLNPKGEPIKVLQPTGILIDSLSELKVTANEENIVNKNKIGDAGNNILYMKQGIAKKQLLTQLPNLATNSGLFFSMTAHVGDEFDLGFASAKKHKLTHSKKGSKITGTTKAFEFINTVLYEIFAAELLNNKEYRTGVLYPSIESDREENCTDLLCILLKQTRNKGGPSGAGIELIVSQREGVLSHLSQFHYIKKFDTDNSLVGNAKNYSLALVPDVSLSRTTVRNIIDTNCKIRRALEIMSELVQIRQLWPKLDNNLMCSAIELYSDIVKEGYSWDVLLNTRGYWVFRENDNKELPYLSTMDLLRMRKGLYKPYFLNEDKLTYNKQFKHLLNE